MGSCKLIKKTTLNLKKRKKTLINIKLNIKTQKKIIQQSVKYVMNEIQPCLMLSTFDRFLIVHIVYLSVEQIFSKKLSLFFCTTSYL